MLNVALVRGDVLRRTVPILRIPEIDIAIGVVAGLVQGDPTLVAADCCEAETLIILENKFSLVIAGSIAVQVQTAGIVAREKKSLVPSGPAPNRGVCLQGRQGCQEASLDRAGPDGHVIFLDPGNRQTLPVRGKPGLKQLHLGFDKGLLNSLAIDPD